MFLRLQNYPSLIKKNKGYSNRCSFERNLKFKHVRKKCRGDRKGLSRLEGENRSYPRKK